MWRRHFRCRAHFTKGIDSGVDYVLSVGSSDAAHACASTTAAFAKTVESGGKPLPIAFTCTRIELR